jgi:hypothetical protein
MLTKRMVQEAKSPIKISSGSVARRGFNSGVKGLRESFHTAWLSKCVHIVVVPLRSQACLSIHIFRFGVLKHQKVEDHIGKSANECVACGPGFCSM